MIERKVRRLLKLGAGVKGRFKRQLQPNHQLTSGRLAAKHDLYGSPIFFVILSKRYNTGSLKSTGACKRRSKRFCTEGR